MRLFTSSILDVHGCVNVNAVNLRTLVNAFPDAGLGVSVALDQVIYETDVLAASNASPSSYRHSRFSTSSPKRNRQHQTFTVWGQRPVLILVGVRLGVNGFNPIYYEAVKVSVTSTSPSIKRAS